LAHRCQRGQKLRDYKKKKKLREKQKKKLRKKQKKKLRKKLKQTKLLRKKLSFQQKRKFLSLRNLKNLVQNQHQKMMLLRLKLLCLKT